MWKQDFSANQILLEINFGHFRQFEAPKTRIFDHLSSSEYCIFGNFSLFQMWNFFPKKKKKNQVSSIKLTELLKIQFLTFWNQPKLISRKTWVPGKLLDFHTVRNPQSKFSIRLYWSVLNYNSWFYIEACMMDGMQLAQKHLWN